MSIPPKLNAERQNLNVVAIHLYDRDVRVVRERAHERDSDRRPLWLYDVDGETIITNQSLNDGKVKEFSRKSRQHLAFVAQNTRAEFDRMITLTYPAEYPLDGKVCKRQLNVLLQWLRRRDIEHYLWFMEFQRRGAPHFHILIEGGEEIDRNSLSQRWYEIVDSGDINHYHAGTRIEKGRSRGGLHRYCVKYSQKLYQKNVPAEFSNVGRLWGCSKSVIPEVNATIKIDSEEGLKSLLREWQHVDKSDLYSILFNASPIILDTLEKLGLTIESVGGVGGGWNENVA